MNKYDISFGGHTLRLGQRTCIMGILNITPDSFSDGGKFIDPDIAIAHAKNLVKAGADIIDIGGESTRPFSEPVSQEEEIVRVIPVIEAISKHTSVPISIDTTKAVVAEKAMEAGAAIINDISALRTDPEIAEVAARHGAPLILMHMKGTPKTMQKDPVYDDLIQEIKDFMEEAVNRAARYNIPGSKIIIDPGIGFGKTLEHNLMIIKHLDELTSLDHPILIGSSRKAFIRNILKSPEESDINPASDIVETGTQATVAAAVLNGAHIVRVHNVANTLTTIKMIDAIRAS